MSVAYRALTVSITLALPIAAWAVPVPVWHNTLDDAASATINSGQQLGSVPSYATFGIGDGGNGYVSSGDSRFFWDTAPVKSIFTGWDDSKGITVDMFVRGFNSSAMSGDLGLWSVGHRGSDNFIIVQFRDNALRVIVRNDSGIGAGKSYAFGVQSGSDPFEPAIPLTLDPNTTYRITVRQSADLNTANNKLGLGAGGDLEVYLEGGAYSGLLGSLDLPTGYNFNFPLETGSGPALGMSIGNRHPFGAAAASPKAGQGIDNVRIFNGSYMPGEIPVPEPASMLLLLVGIAFARRTRGR